GRVADRQFRVPRMMGNAVTPDQVELRTERQRLEPIRLLRPEIGVARKQLFRMLYAGSTLIHCGHVSAQLAKGGAPAAEPTADIEHALIREPFRRAIRVATRKLGHLRVELRIAWKMRALGDGLPLIRKA